MGCGMFLSALLVSMVLSGESRLTIDETIMSVLENSSHTEVLNGFVRVELDMVFGVDEYQEMLRRDEEAGKGEGARMKRKVEQVITRRWTNNIIPYIIPSDYSTDDYYRIQYALSEWTYYTCLTFREYRTGDENYVRFTDGEECSALMGMYKGSNNITLNKACRTKAIILHMLGHALGFWHEHTRPDRDDYVQIMYENIEDGWGDNLTRHSKEVINTYGAPYEYYSIMHYGKTAYGKDGAQTIRTIDARYQDLIGERFTLSVRDTKLANLMYPCSDVNHPDFTFVPGICESGGIKKRTIRTESLCVRYCAGDPDCVSVTWRAAAKRKKRCRIHHKEHGACDVPNPRQSETRPRICRHYRYNGTSRCEDRTD